MLEGHPILCAFYICIYAFYIGLQENLWVDVSRFEAFRGEERKVKMLLLFFRWFGKERSAALRFACTDMLKPYLKVIAKKAGEAVQVLDHYHVTKINQAIDQVRAQEAREMVLEGYEPALRKSRWLLLRRPDTLTTKQDAKLAELLRYNLKSVRSYLLKEESQTFWEYIHPYWAGEFLEKWRKKTMRSKIGPIKKVAAMLRWHRPLLLNWFRTQGQVSASAVEGFNNKAKLTTRKAYGFRSFRTTEMALYHAALRALPVPKLAHEFF